MFAGSIAPKENNIILCCIEIIWRNSIVYLVARDYDKSSTTLASGFQVVYHKGVLGIFRGGFELLCAKCKGPFNIGVSLSLLRLVSSTNQG